MTDFSLAPIYSLTSLSKDTRAVREEAQHSLVRITENGRGAYIFTSEKTLQELIAREREDAAYEAYLSAAIEQGIKDIDAGRFATSREEMFNMAAKRRERCA